MPAAWKTVYAAGGARSAHRLLIIAGVLSLIVVGLYAASGLFPVLAALAILFLVVFAVRRMGVRVQTSRAGVTVTNTLRTHFVPWEDIQDIVVLYSPFVDRDSDGSLHPPVEQWPQAVADDKSLLMFDLAEGPQRIRAIGLSLPGNSMLLVEAVHRDALDVLSESRRQYQRAAGLY